MLGTFKSKCSKTTFEQLRQFSKYHVLRRQESDLHKALEQQNSQRKKFLNFLNKLLKCACFSISSRFLQKKRGNRAAESLKSDLIRSHEKCTSWPT